MNSAGGFLFYFSVPDGGWGSERDTEWVQALEELESIRAFDAAKASDDETIPFEQAVAEIERNR